MFSVHPLRRKQRELAEKRTGPRAARERLPHLEILRRFLEIGIQVDREDGGNCLVRIGYGPQ